MKKKFNDEGILDAIFQIKIEKKDVTLESLVKLWYYLNRDAGIVQWLVHLVANEGTAVRICLLAPVTFLFELL